jgi:hypothetical protein
VELPLRREVEVCRFELLLGITSAVFLGSESPRDSIPYFIVSLFETPQPGGPGPRIYIPQEEDSPVIPPGNFNDLHWVNELLVNPVALVLERTIPTERPPLSVKLVPTFADRGVSRSQRGGSL